MTTVKQINKHIQTVAKEIEAMDDLIYEDDLRAEATTAKMALCNAKGYLKRIRSIIEVRERRGKIQKGDERE